MIRARFEVNEDDYRPVNWPIKHPYWCSGFGATFAVIVAYADDEAEVLRNWPDAKNIDIQQRDFYTFTDRFPKPDWFNAPGSPVARLDALGEFTEREFGHCSDSARPFEQTLREGVAALKERVKLLEQNAARYQWVRAHMDDNGFGKAKLRAEIHIDFYDTGPSLDASIDAAIAAEKK